MRIAIIADYIDDQYAGTYVYAKEFISALERINEEHTIVYIHLKKNPFFKGLNEMIIPIRVVKNTPATIATISFMTGGSGSARSYTVRQIIAPNITNSPWAKFMMPVTL